MDNGNVIVVPVSEIDPEKFELACDDTGCALIPDDGNPHNDITPEQAMELHTPHSKNLSAISRASETRPPISKRPEEKNKLNWIDA